MCSEYCLLNKILDMMINRINVDTLPACVLVTFISCLIDLCFVLLLVMNTMHTFVLFMLCLLVITHFVSKHTVEDLHVADIRPFLLAFLSIKHDGSICS